MKHFALAGNPNCGKTTLFNALTGSTAHVGNWPGVTVDKKEGTYKKGEEPISILDLPGIYSLSPYTPEEVISRNEIIDNKPDCVINIIDGTNLERNLYLTTQILEIDVPVVIALNMADIIEKNGLKVNIKKLEEEIGVPVVLISALKETNLDKLMKVAYAESLKERKGTTVLANGTLGHVIGDVKTAFTGLEVQNPLFHAVKLVENDEIEVSNHKDLVKIVDEFKKTYENPTFGDDLEAVVADERYKYIAAHFSSNVEKPERTKIETKSDKADKILTNRWAAIPIFLVIMFFVFHLTFGADLFYIGKMCGGFSKDSFESSDFFAGLIWTADGINSPGVILQNLMIGITDWIAHGISVGIDKMNAPEWFAGFINDGVVAGVFSVLSFVPQILLLFAFFSILEDSGYMSRVAFILDRIFRRFGLTGRAFMPMIMGFGCSVPAMINTRTLADERERIATIRVIPFFSCGAKLPILTACAGAIVESFGIGNADLITYAMYLVGICAAIICVIVMRFTTLRGETAPFIMELPAYHAPGFKALTLHVWDKLKHFVKKAFTIILASTIIIWFLQSFGWNWHMVAEDGIDKSILGSLGQLLQPFFTPLGFGSQLNSNGWVFAVAAVTGLIAKENVIATFYALAAGVSAAIDPALMEELIAAGEASEDGILEVSAMIQATGITWPALIAFIVFNMTTIPCFAAVATAKAELPGNKIWPTILFWMIASYVCATVVYLTLEYVWPIAIILVVAVLCGVAIYFFNKYKDQKTLSKQNLA